MMMDDEVAETLEKAAEVIETKGWHQGGYASAKGAVCALGAIRHAVWGTSFIFNSTVFPTSAQQLLAYKAEEFLSKHLGVVDYEVPEWNDHPDRTEDQVIDAMKHAAKDLRNSKEL